MNRAAQPPAPRWRIETAAGATWGHYAVAHTPADAANLERAARRAGHRTRILDRCGGIVLSAEDADRIAALLPRRKKGHPMTAIARAHRLLASGQIGRLP